MDDGLKDWVIEKVTEKLPEAQAAAKLVEKAAAYFLERTGRKNIPARAGLLWVDIALALHTMESNEASGRVSSIKRGDTAIEYDGQDGPQLGVNALDGRISMFRVGRLQ